MSAAYAIVLQFVQEATVGHFVEGLREVKEYAIELFLILQAYCKIMNCNKKLSFTGTLTTKPMLKFGQNVETFKVVHGVGKDYVLKHLAAVEDDWFTGDVAGKDLPEPWASVPSDLVDGWEWTSASTDTPSELHELFDAACRRSRRACAAVTSLESMSVRTDDQGEPWSLRWIYVHMIEEYARHVGHMDLIRESIDGRTG